MSGPEPAVASVAELDPTDPYARERQTFPSLTEEMAGRIGRYGAVETLAADTQIFRRGERTVDFFFVLDGSLEIYERDDHGETHVVSLHGPRQFTGELDLFNDRQVLVSGRAALDSRVVRIKRADFKRLVTAEPDIGEIIMRALILRRVGLVLHAQGGVVLIGPGHGAEMMRLRRFLTRNNYPHRYLDTELDPGASGLLACFALRADELPVVISPERQVMRNPSTLQLADSLGLTEVIDPEHVYDVAIVGAGPAGLATAVYAASEGLATIVIEALFPGGQAGTSSKIENYLGFPTGISGQALAGRAQVQAQKFGAHLAISRNVKALRCTELPYQLTLEDEHRVQARVVVVATGARYRKLDVADYARFEGAGIHYAAAALEANLCGAEEVIVVGGGNSAGQAAMYLSRTSVRVHLIVRAAGLAATMSDYLVQRISQSARITLHPHTEITALHGADRLRQVTVTRRDTGTSETLAVGNVFVMIGADPNTEWLDGCLDLDAKGFVITGAPPDDGAPASPFASSRAGVFAVGDVRAGSVKRVASSVGEGSVVVSAIHHYLNPAGV